MGLGINEIMRNQWTLFVSLLTISGVVSFSLIPITNDFLSLFIFLLIISSIFVVTTTRLSNVCVYNKLTRHVSMVVDDLDAYHTLDYIDEKEKIAKLFQTEFVEGMKEAHRRKYKKVRMTTHSWVAKEIAGHPAIQALYNVNVRPSGSCKIPMEVLLLASNESIIKHPNEISKHAFRKRKECKVSLVFKKK